MILVNIDFADARQQSSDAAEFERLALAAGAEIVAQFSARRHKPDPKYFLGKGKAEEILAAVETHQADVVMFNHDLSPAQERNCEGLFQRRVLDRVGLILDIFAQRAQTFEGKLQVELAQLEHLSTRLVRGWSHLERQKGGIGLRGPGETQLETDRRLLGQRIKTLKSRLDKVRKQRQQSRSSRQKAALPLIALTGYTNAGKSTLFNRLTEADVFASDQLFATLDPTLRRYELAGVGAVILIDTVGFVSNLPHRLVDAFKATLEEVTQADLILHVIDAADERREENIAAVESVLREIGADDINRLAVFNKVDACANPESRLTHNQVGTVERVWLSAMRDEDFAILNQAIQARLQDSLIQWQVCLPPEQAQLRAELYAQKAIVEESIDADGLFHLTIAMPRAEANRLQLSRWQKPSLER